MRTKLWENPSSTTLYVTSRTWIKRPRTRRTLPQHCEKVNPPSAWSLEVNYELRDFFFAHLKETDTEAILEYVWPFSIEVWRSSCSICVKVCRHACAVFITMWLCCMNLGKWLSEKREGEWENRTDFIVFLCWPQVSSECRCLRKPLLSCFPGVAEEIGFALWGLVWHPCGEPHECPARNVISKWDGRLSTLRRDDDRIRLQGVSQHRNVQHVTRVTRVTESMIIVQALAWFIQISKWLLPETQIVWSCCRNVLSQIQKGKVMLMLTRVSRIGTKANPDQSHRWCLSPEKESKALAHLFLGNKTKARQRRTLGFTSHSPTYPEMVAGIGRHLGWEWWWRWSGEHQWGAYRGAVACIVIRKWRHRMT